MTAQHLTPTTTAAGTRLEVDAAALSQIDLSAAQLAGLSGGSLGNRLLPPGFTLDGLLTLQLGDDQALHALPWEALATADGPLLGEPGTGLVRLGTTKAPYPTSPESEQLRLLVTLAPGQANGLAWTRGLSERLPVPVGVRVVEDASAMGVYEVFRDARRKDTPFHIWHHIGPTTADGLSLQLDGGGYPLHKIKPVAVLSLLSGLDAANTGLALYQLAPSMGLALTRMTAAQLDVLYNTLLTLPLAEALVEAQTMAALQETDIPAIYRAVPFDGPLFQPRQRQQNKAPVPTERSAPIAVPGTGLRFGSMKAGRDANITAENMTADSLEAGQDINLTEGRGAAPDAVTPSAALPHIISDPIVPETVFVSYSRRDYDVYVAPLVACLQAAGVAVWLDQQRIDGGSNWQKALNDALKGCQRMILCVSPDSLASNFCQREFGFFMGQGKTIIPVICREAELPPLLSVTQYLPYTPGSCSAILDLLNRTTI